MQNLIFFLMAIIANMAMAVMGSPLATRGDAPPPLTRDTIGGLLWCTNQADKFCTVGLHDNFDTHEIDVYIFDKNCNVYASTNEVLTESKYTISWKDGSGNPHSGDVLIHDVIGGTDEFCKHHFSPFTASFMFWNILEYNTLGPVAGLTSPLGFGSDHYQEGWTFESPLPVYYEYRAFKCED
ncbi:hypothetical protein KVR01_003960 [Diaporthe batatas]|uniref:uncharacterized protein n=1 Tax=Diaporthe batatas TaxID=748121 RepID=UPI001D03BF81|nr:uncharacterized protein KVR01_003960 [Diaporthe batatas]KAG8168271.1 hypothetical protein KVR01_003960 [Diaporthe batatas]